jgi:hypothetical protein
LTVNVSFEQNHGPAVRLLVFSSSTKRSRRGRGRGRF